ncbi:MULTISPECIES: GntR family transcriptional regulator [unclassified Pseudomonas]|uniref:GntR family transcriptional regulator n=1 Tax=unclassified Pseudomonas TaxID=196821 RepID=UPI0035C257D6
MQVIDPTRGPKPRPENLVEQIYARLKEDIFEFRLIPGDRFSEGEVAERMQVSRTPVRQALHRLEREGYLDVLFRSGWQVRPFDFKHFEQLYDVRIVFEMEAVRRLCERPEGELPVQLAALREVWHVPVEQRREDGREVSRLDEHFHCQLVEAAGNTEMARLHAQVSEQIRIIRRLDFTQAQRVHLTYEEHASILQAILDRRSDAAQQQLRAHIEVSKAQVHTITLHMLQSTRERATAGGA